MNIKESGLAFRANLVPSLYHTEALITTLSEAWSEYALWQVILAVCALLLAASSGCCPQWLLLGFEALFSTGLLHFAV